MLRVLFVALMYLSVTFAVSAQSLIKDSVMNAFLIEFHYGYYFSEGDMVQRYGGCSAVGPGAKFKIKKNFIIGAEAHFLFGGNVKEPNLLNEITTKEYGYLIGSTGIFENYTLSERGFLIKGEVGKIIAFKKPNVNSGIYVALGLGALQHKIKIDVDEGAVPYLNEEYQKGYDRLTNGFAISQFLGYRFFGHYKLLNFFAGVEIVEAFTQNRRAWNFDTNSSETGTRTDIMFGFKAGLVIPVYRKQTEKYYYY
jgi:hypothetical protein